jgi:hypothetical protein
MINFSFEDTSSGRQTEIGKRICVLANDNKLQDMRDLLKKEVNRLESSLFKELYGKPACTCLDGAIWSKNEQMVSVLLDFGAISTFHIQSPNGPDWIWFLKIQDQWLHEKKMWKIRLLPGRETFDLYEDYTVLDFKKLIQAQFGDDPENFDVAAGVNAVCGDDEFMSKYRQMGIMTFYLKKPHPKDNENYLLKKNQGGSVKALSPRGPRGY